MAEADLSKIVNLIMENPKLIEEIKNLASQKSGTAEETVSEIVPDTPDTQSEESESVTASTYKSANEQTRERRNGLLAALKPYLSEKRSQAIDSMMSIADIIDVVRSR